MKLAELIVEKKEKAADASARYEKFKAMLDGSFWRHCNAG